MENNGLIKFEQVSFNTVVFMSFLKKIAIVAAISPIFLLSGCGNSIVEDAQKVLTPTSVTQGKQITIDNLFKAYTFGRSLTWSEKESDKTGPLAVATLELKLPENLPKQMADIREALEAEKAAARQKLEPEIAEDRKRRIEMAQQDRKFYRWSDSVWKEKLAKAESYLSPVNRLQLERIESADVPLGAWLDLESVSLNFVFARDKKDNVQLFGFFKQYIWKDGRKLTEEYLFGAIVPMLFTIAGQENMLELKRYLADDLKALYQRAQ